MTSGTDAENILEQATSLETIDGGHVYSVDTVIESALNSGGTISQDDGVANVVIDMPDGSQIVSEGGSLETR